MTQLIVLPIVGIAFFALGWSLTTRRAVAEWGLNHGRARVWVALLGKERAHKLTRYFFGPFTMVLGILILLVSIVGIVDHFKHGNDGPKTSVTSS